MYQSVTLIGYVGADPETRVLPNGKSVTNLRLATSEKWTDKQSGEKIEKTEWHSLVAFERQAEVLSEFVRKGSPLHVEGRLQTRKWQDKQGNDRYSTEIVVGRFTFLPDGKGPRQSDDEVRNDVIERGEASTNTGDFDDDIPF